MDFRNVPNQYRPIPFWSWNAKLECPETARQIEMMNEAGMGGYFMHARGGLLTEYMGEEWFDNIQTGIDEGRKHGMDAWAYDENGWPSGFGNGMVNGLGDDYCQKYLRRAPADSIVENVIFRNEQYVFYYEINPFYVDVLDSKVTQVFIEKVYEEYYRRFQNQIKGFFTDEPQISRHGIPWSRILPDEFLKAYGEDVCLLLEELFEPVGDYQNTRMKFYKLITELFSQNFMKKIYDWCTERGLGFTGHMLLEESLESQLLPNGAAMPHYEYFTIPGMDWLSRNVQECLTPLQLGSVAQQLGKKQVIAEDFALCGHNVSFEELRRILEWQMVRGVNLLCPHLQGYSLLGCRKRDYPPAMFYQQPWWAEYRLFIEAMSRIGMILSEGEAVCDTLVLHPQTSAWICFDFNENKGLRPLNDSFLKTIRTLEQKHILFHLGDEIILERHARVEGKTLVVGTQRYRQIVLSHHIKFLPFTEMLLAQYKENGGTIIPAEEIQPNAITDNENITYTKRVYPDFSVHYFVNTTAQPQKAYISQGNKRMDIRTGELLDFDGKYEFAAYDSLLVVDDGSTKCVQTTQKTLKSLSLAGEWDVREQTLNALTLDFCDYYFDGVLQEKNGYVLNIQGRACKLERPVNIRCVYHVKVQTVPERLYLVCERPELYEIKVNGQSIDKTDKGYFIDSAFRMLDISGMLHEGENTIELVTDFRLLPLVYENLRKARIFESEKNKLTYDMEVEPIFLAGDFAVCMDGETETLEKNAFRFQGSFKIAEPPSKIHLSEIEKQGYLFFAGEITVEKEFELENTDYELVFHKKGINAIRVYVNGRYVDTVLWNPTRLDISAYLVPGRNTVKLVLINNLRNLLGPHHLKEGESYAVAPRSFFKEPCIWNYNPEAEWDERYCFVELSLL